MSLNIFSLGRKIRGEEPMFPAKGGGGGGTTTVQKADPWKPAQGQLQDILKQAQALYNKNGGLDAQAVLKAMPQLTPEMAQSLEALSQSGQLMNVTADLNKYTGDAGAYLDQAKQMSADFQKQNYDVTGDQINALSSQLYDNETVQNQKKELASDLQDQYEGNVNELLKRAGASGAMGSSRAGVAQGVMFGKTAASQEKGEADIMNSARTTAQTAAINTLQTNAANRLQQYSTGMQFAGNMGTTLAGQYAANEQNRVQNEMAQTQFNAQQRQQDLQNRYQAAQVSQQLQQAQQDTDYANKLAAQNSGQENLNNYLNSVGKIAGLGGGSSTEQSGGGASKGQSALGGAMAGAAAGATIGGPWGAVAGGVIGGVSSMFSDATLKKDIKLKGKTKSGDEVYDWNWNEKGKKKGMKGKATGVLAQRTSDAAGKREGVLAVNYDKTSVKPKTGKK